VVFALLVVACFVAFFLTQHLKHTPTAVQLFKLTPRFSPTPSGHIKQERISFRLARTDEATVSIVDAAGADVARLLRDHPVARYKQLSLRWTGRLGTAHGYALVAGPNGRSAIQPRLAGRLAPAGEYRVRVTLREQHRSVLSPRSFTLVRP
jgi:glycine cleavage system aminomethyltransferase T